VPVPPSPVTVTGQSQLVYELHLTSFASSPLVLEPLEVMDATGGIVLSAFDAAELERRLYRPGAETITEGADARLIEAGMLAVVYLEVPVEATPEALEHRITFRPEGEPRNLNVIEGASISVEPESPVVL